MKRHHPDRDHRGRRVVRRMRPLEGDPTRTDQARERDLERRRDRAIKRRAR